MWGLVEGDFVSRSTMGKGLLTMFVDVESAVYSPHETPIERFHEKHACCVAYLSCCIRVRRFYVKDLVEWVLLG